MPEIVQVSLHGVGSRPTVPTVATESDTFLFQKGRRQLLLLNNVTAAPLTVNIVGASASELNVPGYGPVDVSLGYNVELEAEASVVIPLDSISAYLAGAEVTITGADAAELLLMG